MTADTFRWRVRQIDAESTDPRMVIVRVLARRDQHYRRTDDIGPATWATAGPVVKELRAAGLLVDRRRKAAGGSAA